MSEMIATDFIETDKENVETKAKTPMQDVNEALKACKFGLFHFRLLGTSFFAVIASVLVSNTMPYILPNAECDLGISLLQKGILNAAPFIGMLISSIVAGFLTDTFGRKIFLLTGFGGMFLFTVFSGLSQTFEMLVVGKFFEGLLFAVAFSPAVTFTSEYCHLGIRDRVMLLQSSFRSIGSIVIAAISWGILTQEWRLSLFNEYIVLNTWNFYLLIASLWSLTACILYWFLPESPKYLVTQHKYEEARNTLIKMYKQNTGKPADTFPFANIWKGRIDTQIIDTAEKKVDNEKSFANMVVTGLHNCKPMFKKPLGPYLALFCTINFFVMVLHNVIRLWFPQLSTIVEHYSNSTDDSQDLCAMLDAYTHDLKLRSVDTTMDTCVPTKSGAETYINSIILGSVCFLPYILSGVLVNKVGKKYLLIAAAFLTIGCTFWLRWANSKTQVVALFSTDMAIGQIMVSLLQATTIEVFPTTTRTLAISVIMMSGRTGTLVGNVAFPILLNIGCVVPFFTLAGIMIGVTMLLVLLPNKKKT